MKSQGIKLKVPTCKDKYHLFRYENIDFPRQVFFNAININAYLSEEKVDLRRSNADPQSLITIVFRLDYHYL